MQFLSLQGVFLKKFAIIRGQCIVGSPFSFVSSGFLTRREINAGRIVLFKSPIKPNNFSSDKKHNL